jgi:histidine ammonia-lyase
MRSHIVIDGEQLTLEDVRAAAHAAPGALEVVLSLEAEAKVARARPAVEQFVAEVGWSTASRPAVALSRIASSRLKKYASWQRNIVVSHAVGVGAPLETAAARSDDHPGQRPGQRAFRRERMGDIVVDPR